MPINLRAKPGSVTATIATGPWPIAWPRASMTPARRTVAVNASLVRRTRSAASSATITRRALPALASSRTASRPYVSTLARLARPISA